MLPARISPSSPTPHYFYRRTGAPGFDFVRPVLGSFNFVAANKTQVYPRHQHRNYQVIFAQRGRYRCLLNGTSLELKPRDVLVVKRGDWHEDIFASRLRYFAVNFDLAGGERVPATDIIFKPGTDPRYQIIRGPNSEFWALLHAMQRESVQRDQFVPHIENSLLFQLFWMLVRALPAKALSPIFLQRSAAQAFSEQLRRVFEQHISENLSAVDIAMKLGISVRTLTKRCREVAGRSPARAFLHYKIEYASRALRQSDIPVKEISHQLGFQNQFHFSRVFRRYLGAPPSHYRKE